MPIPTIGLGALREAGTLSFHRWVTETGSVDACWVKTGCCPLCEAALIFSSLWGLQFLFNTIKSKDSFYQKSFEKEKVFHYIKQHFEKESKVKKEEGYLTQCRLTPEVTWAHSVPVSFSHMSPSITFICTVPSCLGHKGELFCAFMWFI